MKCGECGSYNTSIEGPFVKKDESGSFVSLTEQELEALFHIALPGMQSRERGEEGDEESDVSDQDSDISEEGSESEWLTESEETLDSPQGSDEENNEETENQER
eukprot:TRINITY_DN2685_c0_g1_i2.p1 TRINITY_DN2685_c0_g1~~TRINITY_DN2685_c0_g1_i2.p1  ORF type:complete len:104 (+),score=23.09 TRINITY_DN2685_c0_g1_i2:2-313(+)